jgi:hypothetical protein
MKNAAPVIAAFPALATKPPPHIVATIRRERCIVRHDFSPVTHRVPATLSTIGLLWLASAASSARS